MSGVSFWNPHLSFDGLLSLAVAGAIFSGMAVTVLCRRVKGLMPVWYVYVLTSIAVGWLLVHPYRTSYMQLQRIVEVEGVLAIVSWAWLIAARVKTNR